MWSMLWVGDLIVWFNFWDHHYIIFSCEGLCKPYYCLERLLLLWCLSRGLVLVLFEYYLCLLLLWCLSEGLNWYLISNITLYYHVTICWIIYHDLFRFEEIWAYLYQYYVNLSHDICLVFNMHLYSIHRIYGTGITERYWLFWNK